MSHDPIHDWLDMAFSTVLGDKKAHRKYKKQQARERGMRANERARKQRDRIRDDSGRGLPQDSDDDSDGYQGAPFPSGGGNAYGSPGSRSGVPGPMISGNQSQQRRIGSPPQQYSVSEASSGRASPQNAQGQRLIQGPLPTEASGSNARSNANSRISNALSNANAPAYNAQQSTRPNANSAASSPRQSARSNGNARPPIARPNTLVRTSNALSHRFRSSPALQQGQRPTVTPPGQRAAGSGSQAGSRYDAAPPGSRVPTAQPAPNRTAIPPPGQRGPGSILNPPAINRQASSNDDRVGTSLAPLGDMTRSYLEGMVPGSQVGSRRPRHKS